MGRIRIHRPWGRDFRGNLINQSQPPWDEFTIDNGIDGFL